MSVRMWSKQSARTVAWVSVNNESITAVVAGRTTTKSAIERAPHSLRPARTEDSQRRSAAAPTRRGTNSPMSNATTFFAARRETRRGAPVSGGSANARPKSLRHRFGTALPSLNGSLDRPENCFALLVGRENRSAIFERSLVALVRSRVQCLTKACLSPSHAALAARARTALSASNNKSTTRPLTKRSLLAKSDQSTARSA